jgi:hypothetical protein
MQTIIPKKMKKRNYRSAILLITAILFIPVILSAQEVKKEFHKEYKAGPSTVLDINNKYGDVVISSTTNDQITIDVKVTIELSNREKAEKLLTYIDVQFAESDNKVSARTVIDDKFNFTGWGSDSRRFSIDYTIKMPVGTDLVLANKYGNTDFDELHGLLNLDIKYGNLIAGKMTRGNVKPLNSINLAYGKASITEAGWLDLTARYAGKVEITKCQALLLDSRYSKLAIDETSSLVGESKYDNLDIRNVRNLVLDMGYTDTKIGEVTKKLSYKGNYGSFSVERIPAGFESIETDTRYMGVRLGIDPSANYKLIAKASYGSVKYDEVNFRNQKRIIENNSSEIEGIVGSEESPAASVNVTSAYGTVKLN